VTENKAKIQAVVGRKNKVQVKLAINPPLKVDINHLLLQKRDVGRDE